MVLSGCREEEALGELESSSEIISDSEVVSSEPSSENEEVKNIIHNLDETGEITSKGNVMHTITATEVVDVTEETQNELINETNYLDYASNEQGEQAVKITLLMENMSGKVFDMPYLDNVKVINSSGITNLGGWKEESGSKTEFGYYSLDNDLNPIEELYTVQNGESRMATSTVVLATKSDKIKFRFESQTYGDYIDSELLVK